MRPRTTGRIAAGVAVLALVAAGCGDDDETSSGSTDTSTAEASSDEYCDLSRELDEQENLPTAEQLEALQDAAPDEIADGVDLIIPILLEAVGEGEPTAALEDPALDESQMAIEAFEAEECGIRDEEG
ncbi:hypothetical protein BH18ACT4_BH18ACT4_04790 [soil metagenome]